ncbi:hypothetical protein MUA52_08320 [Staphylococcus agnetis]|uniref:hypothetical protein n=1 Tax=Staphylococcus agnetis TaxID=985762 RepID=UPI0021CE991D|nr:hypothetical protein [Staphylococcus agnetis]UXU63545.1 hypothetical protein MUA84_08385 [Staphylococcus agnetis]UXU65827.1 hypothetical protein MUA52_08320 [Staphylococcus agnetis]
MNIKKKKYTKDGGLLDKPNFDHIETSELDIEKFLNRFKKGDDNMIKKATEKSREVEYIEFNGYENFEEVCEFVGCRYTGISLQINRYGKEVIDIPSKGKVPVGSIFYRYLDPEFTHRKNHDTEDYVYDVTSKDKFFHIYE